MAHHSTHRKELAFYQETTACSPPASWAVSGTPVEFISLDLGNVKEALLVDPTAERRILANGKRKRVKGARNVDWSAVFKMHGTGATTATDAQVAETALSKILTWCCGGVHRTYTRTVVSATNAYTVVVSNATGFVPGCLVGFEDTSSPSAQNAGKIHFARVASIDGDELTLTEALPFTPASGDVAHGTITIHVDEDYLEDAIRAGAIRTWNWFAKLHKSGTEELWQLEGCVGSFALQNLSRGNLPQIAVNMMAANFRHGGADGLTSPTFGTPQGSAQLSMGLDVRCSIGTYGSTTRGGVDVNTASFEPGFTRVRVETGTQEIHRFDGMSTYSVAPGQTKFTATVLPYEDSWYEGLGDGTEYRISYYQPGPGGSAGASAGKAWALHIPRAQLVATPGRADVNEVHGAALDFEAMIADDATGGSDEELEKSPFLIGLA